MNKREFIRNISLLSTSVAIAPSFGFKSVQSIPGSGLEINQPGEQNDDAITLRDKFLGCISGSWIYQCSRNLVKCHFTSIRNKGEAMSFENKEG